ncbi:MAG: dnaE [Gammaproteobacteria bacterium]|jgi:DNA polymerase-3 subunit alpha|nr:dnaE [Gammaproteobacteria bacterium]
MSDPSFIHLRLHTEYSLVDSVIRIEDLFAEAKNQRIPALGLSDHQNLFAAVKFYKEALASGIKPIIGADLLIADSPSASPFIITLFCRNLEGFRALSELVSHAYLNRQHVAFPHLLTTWLTPENCQHFIALQSYQSELHSLLLKKSTKLDTYLDWLNQCFPNRWYLELSRTGKKEEQQFEVLALSLSEKNNIPLVATNDVRFLSVEDYEAHEARVAIHEGSVLTDPKRLRKYNEQQYFRSSEEMQTLFADIPSALQNSVEIAKRCSLNLPLGETFLPKYPTGDLSTEDYLIQKSREGLEARLTKMPANSARQEDSAYRERLEIELKVITQMGFSGYFLIVADFIAWSKANNIPVGPGRGSGAGSLVAYALGITDLDPLPYDLLFERFLNPERVSMPDFDIDFCMDGRDRVIEYVSLKYGRDSVSQIITYGSMAAKAVVRDVGRVLGHPYGFVDKIAKLIPFELGITLDKAIEQEAELKRRYQEEEDVQELLNLALKLEGLARNAGKHAGGVVIAPSKLTDFTPLYCEANGENLVSQFDKDDVEAVGLVKFDFLGLRTLTIIDWAVQNVNLASKLAPSSPALLPDGEKGAPSLSPTGIGTKSEASSLSLALLPDGEKGALSLSPTGRGIEGEGEEITPNLDISQIPLDDPTTYDLLKRGQTTAVFQLESRGMKDLIKRLQPDCFEDIVALVALFRPGPLQSGMVDDFIQRKHGIAAIEYPHPDLEPILKPTYGVILYQEQVMQIAQVLAGYTLGGADLLRRAMGKKKPEEMAKQREIFTEGAAARGVDKDVAAHIFDLMEKFAGYGFNKSHSAAYALLSYQTAWLKTHYPAEFMAAVLSSDMDNTDKVVNFINECHDMGLTIVPPSINQDEFKFTVSKTEETSIIYGLGAIKGAGEAALSGILEERQQNGPYKSLFDLCERNDLRKLNKRVLEALIKSGALDEFGMNRATLWASLEKACQHADQKSSNTSQIDLFGLSIDDTEKDHHYIIRQEWPLIQKLQGEKETLGWYLSGHPLSSYNDEIKAVRAEKIRALSPNPDKTTRIIAQLVDIRILLTKRGDRMAILGLEDDTGSISCALFSEELEKNRSLLQDGNILFIEGIVDTDNFTQGLRMSAKKMMSLADIREAQAKALILKASKDCLHNFVNDPIKQALQEFPGNFPVVLRYQEHSASIDCQLGARWRITPTDALLQNLRDLLSPEHVFIEFKK